MRKRSLKEILKSFYLSFIWLIVLVFVLDLASKWIVQTNVGPLDEITVIPNFFYIICQHNTGAAFSLGAKNDGDITWRVIFIILSFTVGVGLSIYYAFHAKKMNAWYRVALALIIAGDFGNLIDRAFYWESLVGFNGVIDFLSFEFFGSRFATFNIADASLVVGCFLIIILMLIESFLDINKSNRSKSKELDVSPDVFMEQTKNNENKQ